MKIWNDEEVKSLFGSVEACKKSGNSLKEAFASHANKFKRKPNSVRNYYYHEVDNLSGDKKRCLRLGIDLSVHEKTHFENFDKVQEGELFEKIEKKIASGQSVRAACLELSGGDLSKMTRLQNKYQNMKRKLKKTDNIIPFKTQQKVLTDSDINSLFLGLVKLIKKTAMEEAEQKTQNSNGILRKAFMDLSKKEREICDLKAEFEKLKSENKMLRLKLDGTKKEALERHLIGKRLGQNEEKSKRV